MKGSTQNTVIINLAELVEVAQKGVDIRPVSMVTPEEDVANKAFLNDVRRLTLTILEALAENPGTITFSPSIM